MPSYAPAKPAPKRPRRRQPRPLDLAWLSRTAHAIGELNFLIEFSRSESAKPYYTKALAHLLLLKRAKTNRAFNEAHIKARRLVAVGMGLQGAKET